MNLINVENITKSYTDSLLFDEASFTVDEQDYIALLPLDENGADNAEGKVYIYRYFEDEDGNPSLDNITDDEEYEIVADRFDELLDEEEFEEMD